MDNKLFIYLIENQSKWSYEFQKNKEQYKIKKNREEKKRAKEATVV